MKRNDHIHGLRGALAFALFIFHVANSGLPTFNGGVFDLMNHFLLALEYGVELFFGISGIVIVFAFKTSKSISDFLINRVTRIFPVLWVTVVLIAVLSQFDTKHHLQLDAVTLLANLLALPPIFPFKIIHPAAWSISFEFAFYMMFVVYAILLKALQKKHALMVVATLAIILLFGHLRALCFVLGVLVASEGLPKLPSMLTRYSGLFVICALIGWALCYGAFKMPWSGFNEWPNQEKTIWALLSYACAALFAFIGLQGIYYGQGLFSRWLCHPFMQWLGTVSFSLYLWQTITMAAVKKGMYVLDMPQQVGEWSQIVFFLLAVVPTLAVSRVSQHYLEHRMTNWIRMRWKLRQARNSSKEAETR